MAFSFSIHELPEQDSNFQIIDAMSDCGLFPEKVIIDGKIHRFQVGTSKDAGWYIFFDGPIVAGRFGNFKTGEDVKFHCKTGKELTIIDRMNIQKMQEKALAEKKQSQEVASITAAAIWERAGEVTAEHGYIQKKKISADYNIRIAGDGRLIIPIYNSENELSSLQYISAEGEKQYLTGGKVKGCFHAIGDLKKKVYVCEGFATGATIYEHTHEMTVCALSAQNILDVVAEIRKKSEFVEIVIVADNDESGVGLNYANQAASKYNARVIYPETVGLDVNDYWIAGGDLESFFSEKNDEWLVDVNDFLSQDIEQKYIIKDFIPENALTMIHGESGSGKTFITLDMCLSIASGMKEWNGKKINQGPVVYLAGEGHAGLRKRIAGWIQENKPENNIDMTIAQSGIDIDTTEGTYKAIESIRKLKKKPKLIVIDTLHRFMQGDENSAKDSGAMIKACTKIQDEFQCSVLIVHHTGISSEARERARGSSAWRGALDSEISIVDGIIKQKKNKDGEKQTDLEFHLTKITIEGKKDSDGNDITTVIPVYEKKEKKEDVKEKKDNSIDEYKKVYENAWIDSGCELDHEKKPLLSNAALERYLLQKKGMSEREMKAYTKTSGKSMISFMCDRGIIENVGIASVKMWKIKDNDFANVLLMLKK